MKKPGSFHAIEAVENEMGHREFFWHKPHSAG
jgi:hypothetical protein